METPLGFNRVSPSLPKIWEINIVLRGEVNPKIKSVLFEKTFKITE